VDSTHECTGICSSITAIFLCSGTEEYITVIFLNTEEFKSTDDCTLFSCSGCNLMMIPELQQGLGRSNKEEYPSYKLKSHIYKG
jgi:hypothetical protein